MSTNDVIPILLRREPHRGPRRAIETATGTLIAGPVLQVHVWSTIASAGTSVGTRSAVARQPRWQSGGLLVA